MVVISEVRIEFGRILGPLPRGSTPDEVRLLHLINASYHAPDDLINYRELFRGFIFLQSCSLRDREGFYYLIDQLDRCDPGSGPFANTSGSEADQT